MFYTKERVPAKTLKWWATLMDEKKFNMVGVEIEKKMG